MCDYEIEHALLKDNGTVKIVCGVDEVGRGALFGPVVAGAVILDPRNLDYRLKDSKKLSPKKRVQLAAGIYRDARAFSIGWCWNEEIDRINILAATRQAIKMAVKGLQITPDYVLIDGMEPDFLHIPGEGIINGDNRSLSIAAASIIAKVFRDQLLISFSKYFPAYDLMNNKGYPTPGHKKVILRIGPTGFHRKSFRV